MSTPTLHLASSSPRRSELLAALGVQFTAAGVDAEELRRDGESPEDMVLRLAVEKAQAAPAELADLVLTADTAVVLGDTVFGKPAGRDDALKMLSALAGRTHRVMTGVALRSADRIDTALSVTEVRFRKILPDEALAYWQSGEPADKAGAYAIQGLGGIFVEAITGSYTGVVGLPVFETAELLRAAGLELPARAGRCRTKATDALDE
jgi:septum formation protein